jgi:8-oxo-dGTP pyrophosphatase MutT (NUDIX family)
MNEAISASPLPRPSVRILCIDLAGRVLLLQWRDPVTSELLWEPPGGGIEKDETPIEAAQRELFEETGLDGASVTQTHRIIERDTWWKGKRYVGSEPFFVARFDREEPGVSRANLLDEEPTNLVAHRWCHTKELSALDGRIEPFNLDRILETLDQTIGWKS